MSDEDCIHGVTPIDCAVCGTGRQHQRTRQVDRTGHEKLLVFCPAITDDSLLHFNRQGDSYRLRAFTGRLAGKPAWVQPDAPTSAEFLRRYAPQTQIDIADERISVDRTDRWAAIIAEHNHRLGLPTQLDD